MAVKIDKKLNFVSTITRDDGSMVYLHVVPFPYEVVEQNCVLLGNLFNNFFTLVGTVGAPRVAAMMLRNIIKSRQENGDIAPGAPTIIDDIQRLTTVIWNDNGVWKTSPLDAAFKNNLITPDEYREIEGEIVFFMVSSAIQKANLVEGTMGHALKMYSGQLVSLSITEYRDSLPKSKTDTATPTPEAPQELSHIPS
ncbi:hypothetical protein [Citrobacter freundii]|uniref:hypothetical protein n=1 Tax=Citrobacter freundii TaxID=546 RepID=UPI00122FD4BD|nr:hypothetical protein [Citrobacter freundii]EDR7169967.1 hypothetical protein [Salmonella enterica subsp. houtenae]KAA3565267.1 hypothetical protein D1173_21770 [Citrobacter freundii]HAT2337233.1 hypothetical protein [Citrobacter freundii]HAT2360196.1 hypothetical protein [Citrobacter freundii]HAU8238700.1 hypothetical protein [Citrobacter freundii]